MTTTNTITIVITEECVQDLYTFKAETEKEVIQQMYDTGMLDWLAEMSDGEYTYAQLEKDVTECEDIYDLNNLINCSWFDVAVVESPVEATVSNIFTGAQVELSAENGTDIINKIKTILSKQDNIDLKDCDSMYDIERGYRNAGVKFDYRLDVEGVC